MNPEQFRKLLQEKGILLTDRQMEQFAMYYQLLVEWNEKMNLTALTSIEDVYLKHFYDSVLLELPEETHTLCDVGSGAGFPSIPLKIVYPELEVTIVDSLNKRITFLNHLVEALELEGVACYHDRAELFGQNKQFRGQFDVVTARAVAKLSVLSEFCLPLVKKQGYFIALKASNSDEEVEEAKNAITVLGGKIEKDESCDLPFDAGTRHLLHIRKAKETPNKYPRKPGLPLKKPL